MSVVGIDIGSQYSKVAVGYCNTISMVPNEQFKLSTPTVIGYTEKQREFGDEAEVIYNRNYKNTIRHIKRFLGRDYDDPYLKVELYKWNYCKVDRLGENSNDNDNYNDKYRENKNNSEEEKLVFEVNTSEGKQRLTPEQILASYLQRLKEFTSKYLEGAEVKDCVITCPIYFTDAQRRSLMGAAQVVGLNVMHLLNEPTAVAISYILSRQLEQFRRVMFVDMGYSNTQISIVDFKANHLLRMYVIGSDAFLGARDFDYMLFDYFRMQFEKKYNIDLSEYPRARIRLMQGVERVKQLLTANKDADHMLECLVNDIDFNLHITRSEFEILCAPLLYKLETCMRDVIDQMHKRDAADIDPNLNHPPLIHSVEIVGGGTRIRCVQEKLVSVLKQYLPECQIDKCSTTLNGDECIARGAALMCAKESPLFKTRELQIQDINHWPVLLKYPASALGHPTSIDQQIIFSLNSSCPDTTKVFFDQKKPFKIKLEHPIPIAYETESKELQYPMKCNLAIGEFQISGTKLSRNEAINCQTQLSLSLNKHGLLEIPQAQLVEFSPTNEQSELTNFDDNNENVERRIIQNLPVTGRFYSEITSQTINKWIHLENKLANTDRIIKEMNDRRNELETYVYDMRNKLESSHKDLISESNKEVILKKLDDIENWIYDEEKNADSMTYVNKLQELKKFNDMMLKKQQQEASSHHRPQRKAKKDVDNYPEERDTMHQVYPEVDDWPSNKTTRQNKHRSYDNPEVATQFSPKNAKNYNDYNEDNNEDYHRPKKKRGSYYLQDLADFLSDF